MIQVGTFENITHAKAIVTRMGHRLSVHIYAVDGMLVDTGPSRARGDLVLFFREQSISQVVLTHHHEDHTGNAPWMFRFMKCHHTTSFIPSSAISNEGRETVPRLFCFIEGHFRFLACLSQRFKYGYGSKAHSSDPVSLYIP